MAKITVAATTKNLPFIYIRQNIRKCSHVYSSIPLTVGHFNKWKMWEKVLLKISIVVSRLCLCNLYVIWYQKGNTYTMTWEIFWFKSKQKRKQQNRKQQQCSIFWWQSQYTFYQIFALFLLANLIEDLFPWGIVLHLNQNWYEVVVKEGKNEGRVRLG